MSTKQIIGVFDDESVLLKATQKLKDNGVNIKGIYGPSADHDLIKKLTKESRLPYLSVATGVITLILTFAFVYYVSVIDYPLHYGGKPVFAFPPMVVILFLVCILITGAFTTFSFLLSEKMFPGKSADVVHPRGLDDRFYLVLDRNFNPDEIVKWLQDSGVEEIIEKENEA